MGISSPVPSIPRGYQINVCANLTPNINLNPMAGIQNNMNYIYQNEGNYINNNNYQNEGNYVNNNHYIENLSECSCPMCGEKFANKKFVSSGEKKKNFKCRRCNNNFYNDYYFICKNCDTIYCTSCPYSNNSLIKYSCPMCGEQFLNGKFKSSGQKTDSFKCRRCSNNFFKDYYFKCNNCDTIYCTNCPSNNNSLLKYSCPMCGEEYLKGKLQNSGEKRKNFRCRKCNNDFYNDYYFICKKCDTIFCTSCPSSNNALINYICPMCEEQFFNGKFKSSGQKRDNFKCRRCNNNYYNDYYFKCHNCDTIYCINCPKQKFC